MSLSFLEHARTLHQLGLIPIPLRNGVPLIKWKPLITDRPEWATVQTWPWVEANGLAVVLGHQCPVPDGGYWWTLDIEHDHRAEAEEWLDGHVPGWRKGLVAESQREGLHLYCLSPVPVSSRRCKYGDIKGKASIVVVPPTPSFKADGVQPYRWVAVGPPVRWDGAGLPPGASSGSGPGPGVETPTNGHRPLDVAEALGGVPLGQRNTVLFRLASKLRGANVPYEWAVRLVAEAASRCSPSWGSSPDEEPPARLVERVYTNYESNPVLVVGSVDSSGTGLARAATEPAEPAEPAEPPAAPLRFRSVSDFDRPNGSEIPWLWHGFVARGCLTIITGREKLSGKSTLMWGLIAALTAGEPFLERPTVRCSVVMVSEETAHTLGEKIRRFGIPRDAAVRVLCRTDGAGVGWEELLGGIAAEVERTGARLVIIDPLGFWTGLAGDEENQAGTATRIMKDLAGLAARLDVGILIVHHTRKSGDEYRGSTALAATADILMTVGRDSVGDGGGPTRRRVEVIGRFDDCPHEPLLIELTETEERAMYHLVGTAGEVAARERERLVLEALPYGPPGLTPAQVAEETGVPRQRLSEILTSLRIRKLVHRTGTGTRADPYRYFRPDADSSSSVKGNGPEDEFETDSSSSVKGNGPEDEFETGQGQGQDQPPTGPGSSSAKKNKPEDESRPIHPPHSSGRMNAEDEWEPFWPGQWSGRPDSSSGRFLLAEEDESETGQGQGQGQMPVRPGSSSAVKGRGSEDESRPIHPPDSSGRMNPEDEWPDQWSSQADSSSGRFLLTEEDESGFLPVTTSATSATAVDSSSGPFLLAEEDELGGAPAVRGPGHDQAGMPMPGRDPDHDRDQDQDRVRLLQLAEGHGYPRVWSTALHAWIAGAEGWRTVAKVAAEEMVDELFDALRHLDRHDKNNETD